MGSVLNRFVEKGKRKRLRRMMPRAEVVLWSILKGKRMNGAKFRRQFGVGPYVIDFYCPEFRLAIELDGPSHFEKGAEAYDRKRQKFIELFDITFLRFTNDDIYTNLAGVFQRIDEEIRNKKNKKSPPCKGGVPAGRGGPKQKTNTKIT